MSMFVYYPLHLLYSCQHVAQVSMQNCHLFFDRTFQFSKHVHYFQFCWHLDLLHPSFLCPSNYRFPGLYLIGGSSQWHSHVLFFTLFCPLSPTIPLLSPCTQTSWTSFLCLVFFNYARVCIFFWSYRILKSYFELALQPWFSSGLILGYWQHSITLYFLWGYPNWDLGGKKYYSPRCFLWGHFWRGASLCVFPFKQF